MINEVSVLELINIKEQLNTYSYSYNTMASFPIATELQPNNIMKPIKIFADGSKIFEAKAFGASVHCSDLNTNRAFNIHPQASIFMAETLVINEAIKLAAEAPKHHVIIMSDSLSAIQSLSTPSTSIHTNHNIFITSIT